MSGESYVKDQLADLETRAGKFLPYQWQFIFDPAEESVVASGFGSGKSHSGIYKGLILSKLFPMNRGLIGRFHGSDLEDSIIPLFFEICPPSWIRNYNKQNRIVTLKNGSQILFRHLHDAKASGVKTRRVGANLGWVFIDQLEECLEAHWNAMIGRLRLPSAKKRFIFGTVNPNGHDWIYRRFFPGVGTLPTDRHAVVRKGKTLGIAVISEVNRKSRGGFVDDSYFDNMLRTYPPEWIARWLHCSFDEFSGKVYREFEVDSIHNVNSFPIPKHWPHVIGIDVGGDAPWAVLDEVVDDWGNMVVVKEFYKPSVNTAEVANWIKNNTPWDDPKTSFVIDWENKLAMLELQEHGIVCRPAQKKVHAGILRMGGYVHVDPEAVLPKWYEETQPESQLIRFAGKGSPRTFVFRDECPHYRKEMDGYAWDQNSPGKPLKQDDHTCDADRYIKMSRPESAELPKNDKFAKLRRVDPGAAREWELMDRRIEAMQAARQGSLKEMDSEAPVGVREEEEMVRVLTGREQWEWD